MKTVLMIAPYFVPRRRVGSLRPYKFVAHLNEFGWKPVVCTLEEKSEEYTAAEKMTLQDIEIIHLTPPFDRTSNRSQKSNSKQKSAFGKVVEHLADWFDRQVPMDTWYFLFRHSYGKILGRTKAINPDLVWSTGDPWSGHWLGWKLSRDLHKPWIADFRDPWTLAELNLRERSRLSSAIDRRIEKKFVHAADKLVFTSKSAEKKYREYYNLDREKTVTIYNSYQHRNFKVSDLPAWDGQIDVEFLNIIFFGSFRRLSPAEPIAQALDRMDPEVRRHIRVHSFGNLEKKDQKLIDEMHLQDQFITHKKVVPELAPSVFDKADLLLVSTSGERKNIIPAKLWEYLQSNKPILSITPNAEVGDILSDLDAGIHFANHQTDEIADWLSLAVQKHQKGQPVTESTPETEALEKYSSRSTSKQFAELMNELVPHE